MRKIPTLFLRDPETNRRFVKNEVHPDCRWVLDGEGIATRKFDGSCVMVRDGALWRRRELKACEPGTPLPEAGIFVVPEIVSFDVPGATGKVVEWVPVGDDPGSWIHREAFALGKAWGGEEFVDGQTYELVGPKINRNPDGFDHHVLIRHGFTIVHDVPRDFDGLASWMAGTSYEGIVWRHYDGMMAKLKRKDFPS